MLPTDLALVDDDPTFSGAMSTYLREQAVGVTPYASGGALLGDPAAFTHGFYLVDLMLPGIDGVDLIEVLRRRTDAGLLVVSGRLSPDVFSSVMRAGADMYLAKPVQLDQVLLAIRAVQRRAAGSRPDAQAWLLDPASAQLQAPDGGQVALSEADLAVMNCLAAAAGQVVPRERLLEVIRRLGADSSEQGLTATIFRLRRRIERATALPVPLQTRARVGYVFRAPLRLFSPAPPGRSAGG